MVTHAFIPVGIYFNKYDAFFGVKQEGLEILTAPYVLF